MRKLFFSFLVVAGLTLAFFGFAQENPFDIEFPIPELGNCGSLDECAAYCDIPEHGDACFRWATDHGFNAGPPPKEIRNGPGGCANEAECYVYCERPEHIDECVDFAVQEGYMTSEEAMHIKASPKIGPGGCSSRQECDAFCSDPNNTDECVQFAVREGYLTQEQADQILNLIDVPGRGIGPPDGPHGPEGPDIDKEKVRQLLEEIGGPGGCSTFEECDAFCRVPANDQVCIDFAIEHELFPPGELERVRRLQEIEGPGGCRGRECETYCEEPGHELECIEFAEDQGFMSPEEAAEIRRFLQATEHGGPGGCRGRECEAYCNNPDHQDECFEFAKQNNLIPPEELAAIERIQSKMEESGGPGGCRTEQECMVYCQDPSRFDECAAFAVEAGLMSPEQAEMMLRKFIDIEHGGPPGPGDFGPPGDFGGPDGSGGPGFGPRGGPGGFGPHNLENLPPEYRAEVEARMRQFEQFRDQFEQSSSGPGGFPGVPGSGEFPPDESKFEFPERPPKGFPSRDEFPGPGEFPHDGDFPPPNQFPGHGGFPPPDEFPGSKEFPGGGAFPPPDEFPGQNGEFPPPGEFPDAVPPEFQQEFQHQFQQEIQRQFENEIQRQYEEKYRRQFEERSGNFPPPPDGSFAPPDGSFPPPPLQFKPPQGNVSDQLPREPFLPSNGGIPQRSPQPPHNFPPPPDGSFAPPDGSFPPPPDGSFQPPPDFQPPTEPPPSGQNPIERFFGAIIHFLRQ